MGNIKFVWAEIAEIAKNHFVHLFGTECAYNKATLEEVLEAQTMQVLDIFGCLEAEITLTKLHWSARQLAKNKVSGQDRVLVEFYLSIWEELGPVLLEILLVGLRVGCLHPQITQGIIVLLAKKVTPSWLVTSVALLFLTMPSKF